jgi:hypothetical protein
MIRNTKVQRLLSSPILVSTLLTAAIMAPVAAIADPAPTFLSPATVGSVAYDFGKVNQGSTAPLLHKFFLKNANATPVVVERVQVSCGCTTATLGGGATCPDTLAPGKVLEVDTSVDPLRLYGDLCTCQMINKSLHVSLEMTHALYCQIDKGK